MQRHIILASGSPRRKELLAQMGVEFTVVPSDFDEYLDHDRPAAEVAKELGLGKARAVAEKYPDALVIGGDTIVTLGGVQLAKTEDIAQARQWLKDHADQDVLVTSSVVLMCKATGLARAEADETIVHFKPYNESVNEAYLQTNDWTDKAGAWSIQSGAAPLIAYIKGNYDTIVGLPSHLL
ncbi:MAG TPA: Maf family protein, partial [Candidatus Saccharimonadales bacterium]|nr:Maf family protein [Candidatus Saccharimonadales bacterium]